MTISPRALAACAALTLTLGSGASAMAAASRNVPGAVTPQAAAGCGSARVCALITGAGGLSRAKNVNKVTHPTTGVYCVTPKAGVLTLSQVTPLTTIEWGSSSGNNLLAMYSDAKLNCPASTLEFHTFDTGGNPTNGASFFIVVN
ncbi:MAG: hypothetical protein U1E17_07785 [Geminicoccaceae bacterium]